MHVNIILAYVAVTFRNVSNSIGTAWLTARNHLITHCFLTLSLPLAPPCSRGEVQKLHAQVSEVPCQGLSTSRDHGPAPCPCWPRPASLPSMTWLSPSLLLPATVHRQTETFLTPDTLAVTIKGIATPCQACEHYQLDRSSPSF